ncbi:gtpase-activator for ras gtpase [Trichoderma cornu-damae]|uniref:Gtpase-activator for ras gtpase n=1 Tax=Trichoderma cornu-damae TaxID=654480 RepID=A0A9P8QKR1_9HYPO|nr:gtpase-activator for ras gtpase [Trichoderma cornu-damae]
MDVPDYARDCLHGCAHVGTALDSPDENPTIIHWKVSRPGYNYYFCATHRVEHCMYTDASLDQPYCGECAAVYYRGSINVVWMKNQDRASNMGDAEQRTAAAVRKLLALKHAMQMEGNQDGRSGADLSNSETSSDNPSALDSLFSFPSAHEFPDHGERIPRSDITYRVLGTVLIAHRRQDGMFLLPFYSYQGAIGYMPCGLDLDSRSPFITLAQYEEHGDPIFKSARIWACKHQGLPQLPRDIRWVLWNIYMLANEALSCPNETIDGIWKWRGWLWYFYGLADELFAAHHFDAASPEEDWFRQPVRRNSIAHGPPNDGDEHVLGGQADVPDQEPSVDDDGHDDVNDLPASEQSHHQSEVSSSETVIHHEEASPLLTEAVDVGATIAQDVAGGEAGTFQQVAADEETSSPGEDTPDEDTSEEDN